MKRLLLISTAVIGLTIAPIWTIAQVPSYVPTNGLIGWWPFTGNATDSSGNGNNGTVTGATLTTDRFGNTNSAYSFNGTGDFITVPNSASLSLTDSASFSFWMEWSGDNSNGGNSQVIIDKSNTSNVENYRIGIEEPLATIPNKLAVLSNSTEVHSSSAYATATWVHTVVTIKAGVINIYINGVLDFTGSLTLTATNTDDLLFGQSSQTGLHFFFGKIDDIGMWSRVLTQAEITQLYVGANVGINEFSDDNSFSVFPNPFSNQTTFITTYQLKNAILTVENGFGQQVKEIKNISGQTVVLTRENLPTGLYFVRITQDNQIIATKKLVITD